jgi:hypothetical protein
MTERERWIVYPLLFLALGAALRDKLIDRTTTKSIKCQELVIEEEPVGNQPGRVLAKIGRTDATPTTPAIGYFFVKGEVDVDGMVKVDGIVNAKQYAYQNFLFMPIWQPMPGAPMPNVMRLPQQSEPSRPPANESKGTPKATTPAPPADGKAKSTK